MHLFSFFLIYQYIFNRARSNNSSLESFIFRRLTQVSSLRGFTGTISYIAYPITASLWTIAQLKSNVPHRCSFRLIDRVVLHEESLHPSHAVYRLSSASYVRTKTGGIRLPASYRFSNTNEARNLFFELPVASATPSPPFRDRDTAGVLFLRPRNWNASQLRAITPITIVEGIKQEEKGRYREKEKERDCWETLLLSPPRPSFADSLPI